MDYADLMTTSKDTSNFKVGDEVYALVDMALQMVTNSKNRFPVVTRGRSYIITRIEGDHIYFIHNEGALFVMQKIAFTKDKFSFCRLNDFL